LARSSGLIRSYLAQIEKFGRSHPHYHDDLARAVEAVERDLDNPRHLVPQDLIGGEADDGGPLGHAQRLIGRFGRLLRVWPSLVAATRSSGLRLSRPL
jgi:hypothetical protein